MKYISFFLLSYLISSTTFRYLPFFCLLSPFTTSYSSYSHFTLNINFAELFFIYSQLSPLPFITILRHIISFCETCSHYFSWTISIDQSRNISQVRWIFT
jgi:hypothetical protein